MSEWANETRGHLPDEFVAVLRLQIANLLRRDKTFLIGAGGSLAANGIVKQMRRLLRLMSASGRPDVLLIGGYCL